MPPSPIAQWGVEVHADNFIAKIEVASGEPNPGYWQSHQYAALLEHLIQDADTGKWDASPNEMRSGEFYARLLAAIARHYWIDLPASYSVREAFKMLLDEVEASGELDKACSAQDQAAGHD